jgi:hypothetical protein
MFTPEVQELPMAITLCHVFVFVDSRAAALDALAACGLAQSFGRSHPGQGTANVVACFDNAYLEVVWAENTTELVSVPVSRTRLAERSRWRETGACPFGIALRGGLPFPSWEYRAPFLPEGASLSVALASEDPRQPFMFRSPGDVRPDGWTDGLAGNRQNLVGLKEITGLHLDITAGASPSLRTLAERGFVSLKPAVRPRLLVTVSKADGGSRILSLPDFQWLE